MASTDGTSEELTGATQERPPSRAALIAVVFGLSLLHGLAVNLMPVMFPTIGERFGLDQAQRGLLQTSFMVGGIVALISAGYLVNYVGAKCVAIFGPALAGGGAVLFGLANSYQLTLLAAALIAFGFAPVVAVYAAIVTTAFREISQRMYMWIYAVFAFSAVFSTYLVGGLIAVISYKLVFIAFGLFIWAALALLFALPGRSLHRDVGKVHLGTNEPGALQQSLSERFHELARFLAAGLLNRGALYLLGLLVVLDTLSHGAMLAWAPTYFGEAYQLKNIGLVLSASSLGVLLFRVLMGLLPPGRISDRTLLAICYAGSVATFTLFLLWQPSMLVGLVLIGLTGGFTGAQAPTTYSIAIAKFGDRAPAAIPLIDAMGYIGGMAPWLVGKIADRSGSLHKALWFTPTLGLGVVILAAGWELYDRARGIETNAGPVSEEGPSG